MNPIEEEGYHSTFITGESKGKEMEDLSPEEEEKFRQLTVEGNWEEVKRLCEKDGRFCSVNINNSRGTAVHVAVNDGNVEVVESLVGAIVKHKNEKALQLKNERGDTPLHLAATRGFTDICECIIGINGERKELIDIDNNEGETPLFHAALAWQKQTFVYLCSMKPAESVKYSKDLIRTNGDSILHCAIRREFFDLALIIMDKYPKLSDIQNKDGFSPLKLLATRPSAFWSGSKLTWWKRILYHCIPVGTLNVEKVVELYKEKVDEPDRQNQQNDEPAPKNYDTCYLFLVKFQELAHQLLALLRELISVASHVKRESRNTEVKQKGSRSDQHYEISMPEDTGRELVPQNYATCLQFVKFAYMYILGLSGVGVGDIRKMKQKHKWSGQLLSLFMEKPYESYLGSGGQPITRDVSGTETDFISAYKPNQGNIGSEDSEEKATTETQKKEMIEKIETQKKETGISETHKKETAILTAARNGIVEMVIELISKIPSALHETNLEMKNVVLVAVENRQPLVVEALRKRFRESKTELVFDNLIQGADKDENTALHLAATRSEKDWHISGAALQMMWHIKWFQYIKKLVPEHFAFRTNQEEKTAGEIFKDSHKELVKDGSEWLKDTSESCSVVAALLAGVSFATSSTVPGGNNSETGQPTLEGKPAFSAFAIASLIGLCFSVTALIMFLSILTSRKEARDFRIDLPMKLLLGLSSLFVSIVAMFASFCSGHFFVIDQKFKNILFLIYAITCLPVSFYAVAQFPLYVDLLKAITTKVPQASDKGDDL